MAEKIGFGDLAFGELQRYLPLEKWQGRWFLPMVVHVPKDIIELNRIDLNEVGVNREGNAEKGAIYYKAYTFPHYITEPYYVYEDRIRIVLSSLKFQPTPLTDMFFTFKMQNDRLREQKMILQAEVSLLRQELRKATTQLKRWVVDYSQLRTGLRTGGDDLEEQEQIGKTGEKSSAGSEG